MKSLKLLTIALLLAGLNVNAQTQSSKSDIEQITETLMHYNDGTANGKPDSLKKAFHPDFKLIQ